MNQPSLINQRIELEGVRVHNLKHLSLTLPLGKWITCCGVSGSGKSSLAFDTIHAESQRRYLETFSPYSRQFIKRLETPQADRIGHLPPTIAVQQYEGNQHPRSTVGTATSCHEYLSLLFARMGGIVCPGCGQEIHRDTPADVLRVIQTLSPGTRYQIAFPVTVPENASEWMLLREEGFDRLVFQGRTVRLRDEAFPEESVSQPAWMVVDRLSAGKAETERILDSVELAFRSGEDRCVLLEESSHPDSESWIELDGKLWKLHRFSSRLFCEECQQQFLEPDPRLFRYQSPLGACPACAGTGLDSAGNRCEVCGGTRLQPLALAVRISGINIAEFSALTIEDALELVESWFSSYPQPHARKLLEKLLDELNYLQGVGLEYLSLDRRMPTLSSGEAQRVSLSSVLGTRLVNTLYVLDEPSVGLHMRDTEKLIGVLRNLQTSGNTLLVVEHEAAFLQSADEIIEIGPGAGQDGGELVFQGTAEEFLRAETLTNAFVTGRRSMPIPETPRQAWGWLTLSGCRANNLRNITVEFPLGVLCVVSGVSGSGKSSLVEDTLFPALAHVLEQTGAPAPADYDHLSGSEQIQQVVMLDRHPVGNSPRSVPATYLKAFDEIRKVFAKTRDAKRLNLTARDFSFNSASGKRCPKCQGQGTVTVDMQFLAEISITCPDCQGTRYLPEILEIKHRNRSIADVLSMTAQEAFVFFRGQPKLQKQLQCLKEVGLGYIPLGQPAKTLSGGESQRLKIASHLANASAKRVLFLMEEPSMGLHPADLIPLQHCFSTLLSEGHSLIVIEHNLDLIRSADWIIDLGPEAGERGGTLVATGPPNEIQQTPQSLTGHYLRNQSG